MFRDITTLLQDPEALNKTISILTEHLKDKNVDLIAGIESRGFIFGAILAEKLNKGFVSIRKAGKLPYKKISEEYDLEYDSSKLEIHTDAVSKGQNVVIVDDLLATGGTCIAASNLIKKLGGNVVESTFVIELDDLEGRKNLEKEGIKTYSIVSFKGK